MTDREFEHNMSLIRSGDKEGLRAVYLSYLPMIYSQILLMLRNRQSAEDLASEFFIKLWEIAGRYRPGNGHRAWLLTIARNMAIDYLREEQREVPMEELPEPRDFALPEEQICEELTLKQALDTLEEEERQIVDLKIMGELTFKEISRILGRPMGTVAWKYRIAIGKLKRCRYE